jgi:coatomer protein complex subunit alpha (xenin)
MTIKRNAPPLTPYLDMQYNPAERAVLLTSMFEGGSYELYTLPKESNAESMGISPCMRAS